MQKLKEIGRPTKRRLFSEYGQEEALIINALCDLFHDDVHEKKAYQGRIWIKLSLEDLTGAIKTLSKSKVNEKLKSLLKREVILSTHLKECFDRTLWYTFRQEEKFF